MAIQQPAMAVALMLVAGSFCPFTCSADPAGLEKRAVENKKSDVREFPAKMPAELVAQTRYGQINDPTGGGE